MKANKRIMIIASLLAVAIITLIILYPRIEMYAKHQYIFDDIDRLIEQASKDSNLVDSTEEGMEGFSPAKIYVRSEKSLKIVKEIVKEVLLTNRQENYEADGLVIEIYFGDYKMTSQMGIGIDKNINGELERIKFISPQGRVINDKVYELLMSNRPAN